MLRVATMSLVLAFAHLALAQSERLTNGDFEQGLTGWSPFWSRSGGGEATIVSQDARQGSKAVHIEYDGDDDWRHCSINGPAGN